MSTYNYEISPFDSDRLSKEIKESQITIALDNITSLSNSVSINFKAELSTEEETILNSIVENHSGEPLPSEIPIVQLDEGKTSDGHIIFAPTLEYDLDLTAVWKGFLYTAQSNSTNFFDEEITSEIKLRGGWYEVLTDQAALGDYIEFSIIDKNDVLGYFTMFNLTVGVDILELKKFVRTNYVKPGSASKREYSAASASDVVEGLFFRTTYHSAGNNDVPLTIVTHYLEE